MSDIIIQTAENDETLIKQAIDLIKNKKFDELGKLAVQNKLEVI